MTGRGDEPPQLDHPPGRPDPGPDGQPAGRWNTLGIPCVGPRVTVTLNGVRAVAVDEQEALPHRLRREFIGLWNYGGMARRVAFRNLSMRELDGGED